MTAPLALVPEPDGADELPVDELATRIIGLAGRLAAATCRWLLLVAEFDRRRGFAPFGLHSTARWLGHYCGLSRRTAIEHVRVARALARHAPLAAALRAGRISYSHARAISRVSELGEPALVERLIDIAEQGTVGQLEDTVRGLRTVDDNERGKPELNAEYVRTGWRPNSQWGTAARLDPERGALVQSALERIAEREGLSRADALVRMAEIALATLQADAPAPSLRGDQLAAVQIQLDASALRTDEGSSAGEGCSAEHPSAPPAADQPADTTQRSDAASPSGQAPPVPRPAARIVRGPGLPDRVVKRLLCSGRIRTAVLDGATPLDLGRRHRVVSAKQFAALVLRDGPTCAFPGCTSTYGLEAHHVRHWLDGGRTNLANLVLLCRAHHHAHHDGAFTITACGRGRFTFRRPDGRELPRHVDPSPHVAAARPVEQEHAEVAPGAAHTRWDGTRLDRHYVAATLAQRLYSTRRWKEGFDPWAQPA